MAQKTAEIQSALVEDKTATAPIADESGNASQAKPVFKILKPAPPRPSTPEDHTPVNPSDDTMAIMTAPGAMSCVTRSLEGLDIADDVNEPEDSALDEFLVNALKNRQDRIFLLKLDRELCSFINNPSQEKLEFPSMNSYYRMVIHRVANYFKITRMVDPMQKTIVLYKTEQSAIPALRFSDLVEEEEEQPVKHMKLLKRNPDRLFNGSSTSDGSAEPDRKPLSIKEREEAYAKARARIFQEDVPAKPKSPGETSVASPEGGSPSGSAQSSELPRPDIDDDSVRMGKGRKQTTGKKATGLARSPDELGDIDPRQYIRSSPSSRDISRSSSPSPPATSSGQDTGAKAAGKGVGPKAKQSKGDLASECADNRRRKSTASNASTSTSSGTVRTAVGLARTISSSSSQDGFNSPSLGGSLSESPTVNSPSNATLGKGYDYFGPNPSPNAGSVSPMSSGSSRNSYTYPQSSGLKQHRGHSGPGGNGGGYGHGSFNGHPSNASFAKVVNAPTFVPKRGYSKPNQPNVNHNPSAFNSGSMQAFNSGPPGQPPFNSNNSNNNSNNNGVAHPYTPQHINASMPWQDRGMPSGQESAAFFGSPQDIALQAQGGQPLPPQTFPFPNPAMQAQYHPAGQNTPPPFNNNHHPASHNNPHGFHQASYRGGRRHQSHSHYNHQPHFQHPHHSRSHPQMHPSHLHGNGFNASAAKEDHAYQHGSQSNMRYGRPFEGHHGHIPQYQYGPDFYPPHGPNGDPQHGHNHQPGFLGHQLQTSPGENSPNGSRFPYNQKGVYDWNQGQHGASTHGPDPTSMLYNPNLQSSIGGKKPYKGYQPPPMNQQLFSAMVGSQPGAMFGQPSPSFSGGPSGMGGAGGGAPGQTLYDVERRPPKSAELFDPNGSQTHASAGGAFGDVPAGRQGPGDGGLMGSFEYQAMGGANVQPSLQSGHGGSHFPPLQQHPFPSTNQPAHQHQHQHQNQHQQQPTQIHTPVGMNRSYSSSSSGGYGGGNNSSPGFNPGKKNSLLYDYSVTPTPYDGVAKHSPSDSEKPTPSLSHILEIYDFDAQDDIFKELIPPAGSKIRRLKPSSKDVAGQCLVVFKNAAMANEALVAFQEGKETWMGPEANLGTSAMLSKDGVETPVPAEDGNPSSTEFGKTRLQWRFNIKVWTPVLVNSTAAFTAGGSGSSGGSSSPVKGLPHSSTTPSQGDSSHAGNEAMLPDGGEGKDQDQDLSSASSTCSSSEAKETQEVGCESLGSEK
ncbi:R3H domain-containing protein 1 [Mortierella alpina]|nr:R3H domain-containing protein 1 [Mortierella alpina]